MRHVKTPSGPWGRLTAAAARQAAAAAEAGVRCGAAPSPASWQQPRRQRRQQRRRTDGDAGRDDLGAALRPQGVARHRGTGPAEAPGAACGGERARGGGERRRRRRRRRWQSGSCVDLCDLWSTASASQASCGIRCWTAAAQNPVEACEHAGRAAAVQRSSRELAAMPARKCTSWMERLGRLCGVVGARRGGHAGRRPHDAALRACGSIPCTPCVPAQRRQARGQPQAEPAGEGASMPVSPAAAAAAAAATW